MEKSTASTARKKKTEAEPQKVYCLWCGSANQANFYQTKDPHRKFFGKIPYCKDCVQKIYDEKLKRYNGDINLALYYTLRKIDVPYVHTAFLGAVENTRNPNAKIQGEDGILKAYMKNMAFAEKNGWGNSFDDSQDEDKITGLASYDEVIKVKRRVVSNNDDDDYEVIERDADELVQKWGYFDDEDLAYLESEYMDWEQQLQGITDKNTEIMVRQVCLQCNEIRKDRQEGKPVEKKISTLQSLLKTSGLNDMQSNTKVDNGVGMSINDIEYRRPIKEVDKDLADVDNMNTILLGYLGGTSRALGKENRFTKMFDEEYKNYSIDLVETMRASLPLVNENIDKVSDADAETTES